MSISISTVNDVFKIGNINISNTIIWTVFVLVLTFLILMYLAKDLQLRPTSRRQVVAETIAGGVRDFVVNVMGEKNVGFSPYFLSLAAFIIMANLSGFLFLGIVRPPTADAATTLTLGIFTFVLTQYFAIKSKGILKYTKTFFEPIFFLLPINLIGEIANPVSLGFRLFGNITGGMIIVTLMYSMFVGSWKVALFVVISTLLLCLYVFLGKQNQFTQSKLVRTVAIILLVPAFFLAFGHVYFDMFAGILQTFIFCMLSMVFISSAME